MSLHETTAKPWYVLDASVALKWLLNDDPFRAEADDVLRDYQQMRIGLIAPVQLKYEVGHALARAVRLKRVSWEHGRDAYQWFTALHMRTVDSDTLLHHGWRLWRDYQCGFYDAVYLALAAFSGSPLLHADRKLLNALGGNFQHELWLEDYQSPDNS